MNWEMLAAFGQLAAVFVGIPSLIYLAVQIREQTKERRQSAVHAVERTMSDLIAYPGVQQWWETRRHWHTEEFNHVVGEIIAKGNKPKAFSTYNLREIMKQGDPPSHKATAWQASDE